MDHRSSTAVALRWLEGREGKVFWSDCVEEGHEELWIMQGTLFALEPSGELAQGYYRLSRSNLICYSLKACLPFFNVHQKTFQLGFKLVGRSEWTFYVKTPQELQDWISAFSVTSLLTSLESDFSLISELGSGAYGEVFLAHRISSPKEVYAVKRIPRPATRVKERCKRIAREIVIWRSLAHPAIVKLHSVYISGDCVDLVMDYVPGGSLAEYVESHGPLRGQPLQTLAKAMLDVCGYLEGVGVSHRDIKPGNVLMTNDGGFVLADFGLAIMQTTGLQERCGTRGFMAPEVATGKEYNWKADIFSSGVTIAAAAIGTNLIDAKELIAIGKNACEILPSDVEWDVFGVVSSMLEFSPEHRPSARELQNRTVSGSVTPKGKYPSISAELQKRLSSLRPPSVFIKKSVCSDCAHGSTSASP